MIPLNESHIRIILKPWVAISMRDVLIRVWDQGYQSPHFRRSRFRPDGVTFDEADTIFVTGSSAELRAVLTPVRYKWNAFVVRCGERQAPTRRPVWCPSGSG